MVPVCREVERWLLRGIASGNRFVETMLTVVKTCRRQKRSAFEFVTEAVQASFARQEAPLLLPKARTVTLGMVGGSGAGGAGIAAPERASGLIGLIAVVFTVTFRRKTR